MQSVATRLHSELKLFKHQCLSAQHGRVVGQVHLAGQVPEDTAHYVAQLAMEADDL